MRASPALLLLLFGLSAQAQVYKWVDENGVVHYTDRPPAQSATPAKLPPVQTYKGGTVPKLDQFSEPAEARPAEGPIKIRITAPAQDETFRNDSEGQVTVSVLVAPALGENQALVYYLNGVAQGAPTRDDSMKLQDLERGAHNISVAVVEGKKELSRSETVTIHMKQAAVRKKAPAPPPRN